MVYGDPEAKDALRILVDFRRDDEIEKIVLHNFAFSLQESGGLENFVFERLPRTGAERMTAIQRLRTEIMAGTGPDVFILAAGTWERGEEFIPYPEKAYTVIDMLMRESTQLDSHLFTSIISSYAIPLNNNAYHPDYPVHGFNYLDDTSLKELTDIKEQITAVNFYTDLSGDIDTLLYKCEAAYEANQPIDEIVHEVYVQMQRKLRE